jgi:hypothetical protein
MRAIDPKQMHKRESTPDGKATASPSSLSDTRTM